MNEGKRHEGEGHNSVILAYCSVKGILLFTANKDIIISIIELHVTILITITVSTKFVLD